MFRGFLARHKKAVILSFIFPALILLLAFVIMPMGWALYISFTNQSLIGEAARNFVFVGLSNYIELLFNSTFPTTILRSFVFLIGSIMGQFILGFTIALLTKKKGIRGKKIISTVMITSWAVPEMGAAFIWISVYNSPSGLLNTFSKAMGLPGYNWVFAFPMAAVIIANIWRGTGFSFLFLSSALESIPTVLYESADIDGASEWKKLTVITIPLMRYQIMLNLLLITFWTFMVFTLIFAITGGGPFGQTEVASIFIYKKAFVRYKLGLGSAASVIILAVNLVFAYIYLKLSKTEIG